MGHVTLIESPVTVICLAGSGFWAGPLATAPSAMRNSLPWQAQLIVPFETVATMQPWWVQTAEKALKPPFSGWVTTTFSSLKILPPPTGMSPVLVSASPAGASPPVPLSAGATEDAPPHCHRRSRPRSCCSRR